MNTVVIDSVVYGAAGVVSTGAASMPAVTSNDSTVQIVSIVCTMIVALANVGFGFLMYQMKKQERGGN